MTHSQKKKKKFFFLKNLQEQEHRCNQINETGKQFTVRVRNEVKRNRLNMNRLEILEVKTQS